MNSFEQKWKAQFRKGYLEFCVLLLIEKKKSTYGFELLKELRAVALETKEGSLYPLLSRLLREKLLKASWNLEGELPRKFYTLTSKGEKVLLWLKETFSKMVAVVLELQKKEK